MLAEACKKMAEGEVLQLYYNDNPAMPETDYLKIVEHKTAGLIAASCRMGAILAEASEAQQDCLFRFGQYLGMAFQVVDDTLITRPMAHLGQNARTGPSPGQSDAATASFPAPLPGK